MRPATDVIGDNARAGTTRFRTQAGGPTAGRQSLRVPTASHPSRAARVRLRGGPGCADPPGSIACGFRRQARMYSPCCTGPPIAHGYRRGRAGPGPAAAASCPSQRQGSGRQSPTGPHLLVSVPSILPPSQPTRLRASGQASSMKQAASRCVSPAKIPGG